MILPSPAIFAILLRASLSGNVLPVSRISPQRRRCSRLSAPNVEPAADTTTSHDGMLTTQIRFQSRAITA